MAYTSMSIIGHISVISFGFKPGLCFFSSDWLDLELPSKHRFPIEKYRLVRELCLR